MILAMSPLAVRSGDMAKFTSIVEEFGAHFKTDETYTLILRLRHNVIKAGVRIISLSYSRISLQAIADKLLLDSADDAEYIVAKCIRDGVIEATIDHKNRFVASKDVVDVYATGEPQEAFHQRIMFCLKLHNDSVKVTAPLDWCLPVLRVTHCLHPRCRWFSSPVSGHAGHERCSAPHLTPLVL